MLHRTANGDFWRVLNGALSIKDRRSCDKLGIYYQAISLVVSRSIHKRRQLRTTRQGYSPSPREQGRFVICSAKNSVVRWCIHLLQSSGSSMYDRKSELTYNHHIPVLSEPAILPLPGRYWRSISERDVSHHAMGIIPSLLDKVTI